MMVAGKTKRKKEEKMKIKILHWVGEFGLLIPMKTGAIWQHQTDGCACNQIYIEGIFVPLDSPFKWDEKRNKRIDYLDLLANANYHFQEKKIKEIWKKINNLLEFTYEDTDAPRGQPKNREGIKWIKIKKIKYPPKTKDRFSSWERECEELARKYHTLINKRIALVYPNCD